MAEQRRVATESISGQRPYQEDAVLTENLPDGRLLVAVADGMGGHAAGEVASALALETLGAEILNGKALDEAFRLANRAVHARADEPGKHGMGTTLVAMLLDGDAFQVANVGDSRLYLISETGIRQLSHDHSFVAEAMARGQTEEEATSSQWKDALTRSVGTADEVEVDLFGPFPLEPNTAVLVCSDGLYKTLSDLQLLDIFSRSAGPRGAAQALVASAFESGSDDNITVAIAEFGEVPRRLSTGTMPLEWEPPAQDTALEADPGTAGTSTATSDPAEVTAGGSGAHNWGTIFAVAVIVLTLAVLFLT